MRHGRLWSRPSRPRCTRLWPGGASRATPGPPARFPSIQPAPGRPRQSGCASASFLSNPLRSRWYKGVGLVWARAKRLKGCTSSSPSSAQRGVSAALPPPAPAPPWRRDGGRPAGGSARRRARGPPGAHDGTERRMGRPQDAVKQTGGGERQDKGPHGQNGPAAPRPPHAPLSERHLRRPRPG